MKRELEQKKSPAEQRAEAWGLNVSLIEANLERTPMERLEVLQQTLDMIFELRRAWQREQHKGNSPKTSGKSN